MSAKMVNLDVLQPPIIDKFSHQSVIIGIEAKIDDPAALLA
jgi:hypothetical protein